jgi:hypothetical protein
MNYLLIIQGHLVTKDLYDRWNGWDQGHLLALCDFDLNQQWVDTGEIGATNNWTAEDGLCLECLDHPDYALTLLGAV